MKTKYYIALGIIVVMLGVSIDIIEARNYFNSKKASTVQVNENIAQDKRVVPEKSVKGLSIEGEKVNATVQKAFNPVVVSSSDSQKPVTQPKVKVVTVKKKVTTTFTSFVRNVFKPVPRSVGRAIVHYPVTIDKPSTVVAKPIVQAPTVKPVVQTPVVAKPVVAPVATPPVVVIQPKPTPPPVVVPVPKPVPVSPVVPKTNKEKFLAYYNEGVIKTDHSYVIDDVKNGRIHASTLATAVKVATFAHDHGFYIKINTIKSGHPKYSVSGYVSNHYYGMAFDIYSLDHDNLLVPWLHKNAKSLNINELIYANKVNGHGINYYNLKHGNSYSYSSTVTNIHKDHIHISTY